jgi:hypothetical protein
VQAPGPGPVMVPAQALAPEPVMVPAQVQAPEPGPGPGPVMVRLEGPNGRARSPPARIRQETERTLGERRI